MVSENEKLFRETVKHVLKMGVMNNLRLTPSQKQNAIVNIDKAGERADWFVEMLNMCGYNGESELSMESSRNKKS